MSPERQLVDIVAASPCFMAALRQVSRLGLSNWCIGAGAVRNLVWDTLHDKRVPSPLADVDVAYFDATDLSPQRDAQLQSALHLADAATPWEVTNQAGVHLWFEACFGHAVEPLRSLDEAVASWPEFATAVGITMLEDASLKVIAPHGLDDLFAMVVRRNPARVSVETYRARVAAKRYADRWPCVTVVPCG